MSIDHNRIKVADLEKNLPNKILTTNTSGELEFSEMYNELDCTAEGKVLDARQGKELKDLIDNISELLKSDNLNLDTIQELVDAIETVQNSLNTILVNDLSTGGITKALTAEMGKLLQDTKVDKVAGERLINAAEISKLGNQSGVNTGDQILPTTLPASDVYAWAKEPGKPTYSNTEVGLGNVDNTSDVNKPISTATQTALNSKEDKSNKNIANGYAGLGSDGKLLSSQLPSIAISNTFVVATQAAMLALTVETGDVAVRTDLNKSFILKGADSTLLGDWQELLTPTDSVSTVFGRNGLVSAQAGDYTADQITETTTRKFQTANQQAFNDATSSIQTQLNNKEAFFTKNTAFNRNFGTTTGTVAEGNDSRIVNGQTAFSWGNHTGLYQPLENQRVGTGYSPSFLGLTLSPVDIYNGTYSTLTSGYGNYTFNSNGAGAYAGLTIKAGSNNNVKFQSNGSTIFGDVSDNGSGAKVQVNGGISASGGIRTGSQSVIPSNVDIFFGDTSTGGIGQYYSPADDKLKLYNGIGGANVLEIYRPTGAALFSGTVAASGFIGNATTATNIYNAGTVTLGSAIESNAITITQPSYTTDQPVKLLNFGWYNETWSIGNIRSTDSGSNGLGFFMNGVEHARFVNGLGTGLFKTGYLEMTAPTVDATTMTDFVTTSGGGVLRRNSVSAVKTFLNVFSHEDGTRASFDFNTKLSSGIYNQESYGTNYPGSVVYGNLIVAKGIDTGLQIYGGYTNDELYFRGWHTYGAGFTPWRNLLHSGNFNSYAPSLTGSGASGTWNINIDGSAVTANRLTTNYIGGTSSNPQTYFGQNVGLKVAMTGHPHVWSDTLWINGYAGGDVLDMCALHTIRNGQPRMWISSQQSTATSYGTSYEFLSTYNMGSHVILQNTQSNWNGVGGLGNVVGMLAWKNYGNNHVIFDASNGTSPSGTGIDVANPTVPWGGTYPTLMGWNGNQTYGVRVDSARNADNLGGLSSSDYLRSNLASGTPVAVYYTTGSTTSGIKVRLPFNTNDNQMVSFTVRLYQSYQSYDVQFSGYLYNTINQWHLPKAIMICGSTTINVIMGRDSDGRAYAWLEGGNYTGAAVLDVVGGYIGANWNSGWTITDDASTPNQALNTTVYPTINTGNYGNYALPLTGGTLSGNLLFSNSGTTKRGIQGTNGDNDFWFIGGGAAASNGGYLEIATGDDGQNAGSSEPIFVSQYGPGDPLTGTLYRRAVLLDEVGNTNFPGNISTSVSTLATAILGSVSSSWGGNAGYPTLYGSSTDKWIMHINPHISYVENGVNGHTGTGMTGATIRFAGNHSASTYWDTGVGVNNVGTDKFSIGRAGNNFFSIGNGGGVLIPNWLDVMSSIYAYGGLSVGTAATRTGALAGTSNAIAIGDSDTGFRQNGDGVLETWANNALVRTDTGSLSTYHVNLRVGTGLAGSYIYMGDVDEGERIIHCNSNRIGFLSQSGAWGAWCDDSGNWASDGSIYAGTYMVASRFFAGYDPGSDNSMSCSNWFRSSGNTGWHNGTYDGGIYMTDSTYVRVYNGKKFKVDNNIHLDANFGHTLVGLYTSDRYQGVWAMGDAYKLPADGTTPGNLYGLSWTHTNVGGQSKAGLSHQLLVMEAGTTVTALGTGIWTSGVVTTTSQFSGAGTGLTGYASGLNIGGYSGSVANSPGRTDDATYPILWGVESGTSQLYSCSGVRIHSSTAAIIANKFRATAAVDNGYGFWSADPITYGILMSDAGNTIYGGRIAGETTSDYNMYFNMSQGTNRGFVFRNSYGTPLFSINGNGVRAIGDIIAYTSSDNRLKDNVKKIQNPLEKIAKIGGYTFDWNSNQDTHMGSDIGVIAQEIEAILPEIVTTRDNGFKAVKYEKIVPLLIECVKEQQTQINELKELVNKLLNK